MTTDTWNAGQYLKFASERTRPCLDLAARVLVPEPRRIIDLGCGPGNSTEVLAARWPKADLTGLDNSGQMIEAARKAHPAWRWAVDDITAWAEGEQGRYDVLFSNAAMQWVGEHETLFPKLLGRLNPGGALAIQVPNNMDAPAQRIMREIERRPAWKVKFPVGGVRSWHVHDIAFYHDLLAPRAAAIDFWQTTYLHVMPNAEAIVEWYRGTGLRPWLDALQAPEDKQRFTAEYLEGLRRDYPPQPNGSVLLPFPRLFLVAYVR